jgi:hypothetical protein
MVLAFEQLAKLRKRRKLLGWIILLDLGAILLQWVPVPMGERYLGLWYDFALLGILTASIAWTSIRIKRFEEGY